jgi:hypothetical protein
MKRMEIKGIEICVCDAASAWALSTHAMNYRECRRP